MKKFVLLSVLGILVGSAYYLNQFQEEAHQALTMSTPKGYAPSHAPIKMTWQDEIARKTADEISAQAAEEVAVPADNTATVASTTAEPEVQLASNSDVVSVRHHRRHRGHRRHHRRARHHRRHHRY